LHHPWCFADLLNSIALSGGQSGEDEPGGCHPLWMMLFRLPASETYMRKTIKIFLLTLLFLLIIFSAVADLPVLRKIPIVIELTLYLRIISILGLIIAAVIVWNHRRKMEVSQKYRRADQLIVEAEASAKQKETALQQAEEQMKAEWTLKEKELESRLVEVQKEYQEQMRALKEQNMILKEHVAKLMGALKTKTKPVDE
jgi:hypothetical protein